jgi:hypothetical protein
MVLIDKAGNPDRGWLMMGWLMMLEETVGQKSS